MDQNPTFVQLLGMCPTLATTTSLSNAIGMGLAATAVLICSNIFISLLRKFIPKQIRIVSYIIIISGFVTAVELLMHAY
ncbi:electron transport complex subunit RsxE, partial [Xanthomonas citri pv. citri]|nr:electron transport complex subunit RsxE [Xanthomonas citri pv. citri]